jgi:hypothetical protein
MSVSSSEGFTVETVMKGAVLLLLAIHLSAAELQANLDTSLSAKAVSKLFFGMVALPQDVNLKHPPEGCLQVNHICALESAGRFPEAFTEYEQRLSNCSVAGWEKLGDLGNGHAATVALKVTPCGKHVAMKGTRSAHILPHIQFDCMVLKEVNDVPNSVCPQCFPQYYYSSNHWLQLHWLLLL